MGKKKTLFDHLNQITFYKKKNYWDGLEDEDKKTFSSYMINRFLSMESDYVEIVNEVQSLNLSDEHLEKVYTEIFPKKKIKNKYQKASTKSKNEDVDIISEYYEISKREAELYASIMGADGIEKIKKLYGERFNK